MLLAPIPANDPERLAALHALLILDTPPEQRFDRIVHFAAQEFDVPVALISLVDRERLWLKSRVGTEACEISRDTSFCGHAIQQAEPLVIPDTAADPRFADNPWVTQPPFMRAYVGAPLVLPSGHIIGTLCIMDVKPRSFDATDLSILGTLRDLVMMEVLASEDALSGDKHA